MSYRPGRGKSKASLNPLHLPDFRASGTLESAIMSESIVLTSIRDAWSEEQSRNTLNQLRKDYPKYSDNELYAIWSNNHGLVPFDGRGKVVIEQWQMSATEDGKHVQPGGFKVSRPLYGRALRAQQGASKPRQAARRSRSEEAEPALRPDSFMSPKALGLAKQYDSAARILHTLVEKQREVRRVAEQLQPFSKGVLIELAASSDEAAEALQQAGLVQP